MLNFKTLLFTLRVHLKYLLQDFFYCFILVLISHYQLIKIIPLHNNFFLILYSQIYNSYQLFIFLWYGILLKKNNIIKFKPIYTYGYFHYTKQSLFIGFFTILYCLLALIVIVEIIFCIISLATSIFSITIWSHNNITHS